MIKVVMFFMIFSIFETGAEAHDGSIGIYTSMLADDCDADINPFVSTELFVVYFKSDGGPDGITGAEFKAEMSPNVAIQLFTPAAGAIPLGDISTGIGIAFSSCTGTGLDYIYVGSIDVVSFGVFDWTIQIVANPESEPAPGIWVSDCAYYPVVLPVLGGWFHEGEGACNVAGESTSWGAIKSIYTE